MFNGSFSRCKKSRIPQNNTDKIFSIPRKIMDDAKLLEYLKAEKKITLFKNLQQVWAEIRKPSKLYIVLQQETPWNIRIHAIFREGIAIYHEKGK